MHQLKQADGGDQSPQNAVTACQPTCESTLARAPNQLPGRGLATVLLLGLWISLTACGQKGPLLLPDAQNSDQTNVQIEQNKPVEQKRQDTEAP